MQLDCSPRLVSLGYSNGWAICTCQWIKNAVNSVYMIPPHSIKTPQFPGHCSCMNSGLMKNQADTGHLAVYVWTRARSKCVSGVGELPPLMGPESATVSTNKSMKAVARLNFKPIFPTSALHRIPPTSWDSSGWCWTYSNLPLKGLV